MTLHVASLCSGYGGLDLAVEQLLDAELTWYAQYEPPDKHGKPDKNQHAARIMAHRFPGVPNHGDITTIDYRQAAPVDILTAGFPCQDISLAGKRAGMREGTRSGLWSHVARAIEALRPSLVLIENVRSLTSAWADSDLEPCPWCVGDSGDEHSLRALGAVLGDLAGLGFDASWQVVRASDVGAPHKRERVFILAWPAGRSSRGSRWASSADAHREPRDERWFTAPGQTPLGWARADARGRGGAPLAHAAHIGHERDRDARDGRTGPADRRIAAADSQGDGRHEGWAEPARLLRGPDAPLGGGAPPAAAGCDARTQDDPHRATPARSEGIQRGEPGVGTRCDAHGRGPVDWGAYGPAVRRWEVVLGRPAPKPVDDRGRLAAPFVEWMQGLDDGWVTGVPDIPRAAQLKALGNGVVPQQAAHALRSLLCDYELAMAEADPLERAA